jgi:hypothetical protein
MTRSEQDLDDLLQLVREDLATPEVLQELQSRIARDRDALRQYVRAMHFQASLCWLLEGQAPRDGEVRAQIRRIVRARRRRWLWAGFGTVVSASLMLAAAVIFYYRWSADEGAPSRVVGRIELAHEAVWEGGSPAATGSLIRTRRDYQLRSGRIRLELDDGAQIAILAPAAFRVDGADLLLLHQGTVLAEVPPQAIGFTVRTPAAEAVDLGTRFGVVAQADGTSEIHVLEGQVRAAGSTLDSEVLHEEQAMRYSADGQTRQEIRASEAPFEACLPLSAGIIDLRGRVQFHCDPGKALGPRWEGRSATVHLFRERAAMRLPGDLTVIGTEVNSLPATDTPPLATLPAGVVLDCFFLHLGSSSGGKLECDVTFARPILGLVLEPEALNASDAVFAIPEWEYLPPGTESTNRGAIIPAGGRQEAGDHLTLSADRRTISLQLNAGATFIDQLRVFVEAEPVAAPGQP